MFNISSLDNSAIHYGWSFEEILERLYKESCHLFISQRKKTCPKSIKKKMYTTAILLQLIEYWNGLLCV